MCGEADRLLHDASEAWVDPHAYGGNDSLTCASIFSLGRSPFVWGKRPNSGPYRPFPWVDPHAYGGKRFGN